MTLLSLWRGINEQETGLDLTHEDATHILFLCELGDHFL